MALAVVVSLALWLFPRWQVTHTPGTTLQNRFDREDESRKTLAQIIGGTIVVGTLYMSVKTFGLSREGQITDRFTKAIEQLGSANGKEAKIEVRLGAIYALERIAIDSPRDHWTIMEILTAYVRQNAPIGPDATYLEGEKPRTDIQAILTVLGRRRTGPKRERPNQRLDVSNSHLSGANLAGANLQGADLDAANLQGGMICAAKLQGATLNKANLKGANLFNANLQDARLFQTRLQDASLWQANLQDAYLPYANLQGADLDETKLQGANLDAVNFSGAHGLTIDQIKSARVWRCAHYNPDFRKKLGLPPEPIDESTGTHAS